MLTGIRNFRRLKFAVLGGFVLGAASPAGLARATEPAPVIQLPSPYKAVSSTKRSFGRGMEMPQVLHAEDTDLYRRIFDVQESGQWRKADALIKQLENSILLGHVMAQRYLHPTKYRSKYPELKGWLAQYNDHPEAARLHKLAIRRKPANWKMPKRPVRNLAVKIEREPVDRPSLRIPSKRLSSSGRSKVRNYKRHIRRALRRGHTLVAKRALQSRELKKLFSTAEYDEVRAKLGQAYFSAGRDQWALEWVEPAAERSGKYIPQAHWTAGLANWRLGKREIAADHFAKAANLSRQDDWFHAGAAFWAGRAYLVTRQPERVNEFLEVAAKHPRTFYGQLAGRVLGKADQFSWELPRQGLDALDQLSGMPGGQRALALLQVGRVNRAEKELRKLAMSADEQLANGILALAAHGNMASLAVRLDYQLYPNGGGFDGAAYPIPTWTPTEGFRVDRALIYALIHQESKFNPKAKSWAGARGLMQLMPGTASFVARDRAYRWGKRSRLFKPEHNIDLGQRYIEILLKDKKINGDLFLLAAAWNGGPGNLNKWRRKNSYKNDPLFFIESIPSRETRNFIERVLANLWIYRDRLGQPTPSLDAIAQGDWPVYMALGQEPQEVAEVHGTRK
jgi:soluble lytic murein transglycosylase